MQNLVENSLERDVGIYFVFARTLIQRAASTTTTANADRNTAEMIGKWLKINTVLLS